jgi:aarF domain-containing kinase
MRPLQDQCYPTPYPELEHLFEKDTGKSIAEQFSEFDEEPVGVASLAQVHVARDKESGKRVAVKIQHPHLEEFARIE